MSKDIIITPKLVFQWLAIIALSFLLATGFVYFVITASIREDELHDQQRQDRCEKLGETIPTEWRDYCKGQ